jgi:hypothetical protein
MRPSEINYKASREEIHATKMAGKDTSNRNNPTHILQWFGAVAAAITKE